MPAVRLMWFVTAQVACSERTAFASLRIWATFPLGNLLLGARTARDGEPSALLRKTTPCAGAMSRAGLPDAPFHAPTHTDAVAAVRAAAAAV